MPVKADLYRITLRFPRLFPDPVVFEDQTHFSNRYLLENGLTKDKAGYISQTSDEIVPLDERGKPSVASGTAKYRFEGKTIVAEYMSNAFIRLEYIDFGTGLSVRDHSKFWGNGKIGELRFELREFTHQPTTFNIPEISDLYRMLKDRATPTLATIELDTIPDSSFRAVLSYIDNQLRTAAKGDGLEAESYAAKDLSGSEKAALEKRLTRPSSKTTVFVILSREQLPETLKPSQK